MKHLNKYDSRIYKEPKIFWAFECDEFKVHTIITGPNKGKISFRYLDKSNGNYSIRTSCILGCAKTIDTKYETDETLRNIELGGRKFRKVFQNSIEAIIKYFVVEKYGEDITKQMGLYLNMYNLVSIYGSILSKIMQDSNNLGEVMNKLKIVKNEILKEQEKHFKKWELENDTNKYNL